MLGNCIKYNIVMKTSNFLFVMGAAALLSACSGGASVEITHTGAQLEGQKNWSLIAPDGKVLYEDEFSNCPSVVVNGYFSVEESDGVAVYKADKKPVPVGQLNGLYEAGFYTEGVMPVTRPNSRIEMVDGDGKTLYTLDPIGGEEVSYIDAYFTGGLAAFELANGKQGCINPKGEVVIRPEYYLINSFNDGVSVASKMDDEYNLTYYVLSPNGDAVKIPNSIQLSASYFYKDICAAYRGSDDDRVFGFINKKGEFARVTTRINYIREWNKDYFIFTNDDGKDGLMDMRGDIIIRAKYNNLYFVGDNKLLAQKDNSYAILDMQGNELKALDVNTAGYFLSQHYAFAATKFQLYCQEGNEEFLMNYDGEYDSRKGYDNIAFSVPSLVHSRYFDLTGTVRATLDPLTASGYGRYELGAQMSTYCSGRAENYRNKSSLSDDDYITGYHYSVDVTARSNNNIAYDSTPYQWYYTWSYNPNSKVNSIIISLDIEQDVDGLESAIARTLEAKGFSQQGNAYVNGSTRVTYTAGSSSATITVSR